ncbi:MAG: hypothetical protein ACE5K0_06545 [Candidatus Methanofastidiosia archaeon]
MEIGIILSVLINLLSGSMILEKFPMEHGLNNHNVFLKLKLDLMRLQR